MASKITPLYAQTRILLNLWAFGEAPVSKSKFVPKGSKAYAVALEQLVADDRLTKQKGKHAEVYDLTAQGLSQLSENLLDEAFGFNANIGCSTTNAILSWFRQNDSTGQSSIMASEKVGSNGHLPKIASYENFAEIALQVYDQLNRDYNLDDLVPIHRIRREVGNRLSRHDFNEWLLEVQANDLIQLMGGELPNVTSEQLEDSVAIPGGGTRFYVKRLHSA